LQANQNRGSSERMGSRNFTHQQHCRARGLRLNTDHELPALAEDNTTDQGLSARHAAMLNCALHEIRQAAMGVHNGESMPLEHANLTLRNAACTAVPRERIWLAWQTLCCGNT
jgi:hypothetical protein